MQYLCICTPWMVRMRNDVTDLSELAVQKQPSQNRRTERSLSLPETTGLAARTSAI